MPSSRPWGPVARWRPPRAAPRPSRRDEWRRSRSPGRPGRSPSRRAARKATKGGQRVRGRHRVRRLRGASRSRRAVHGGVRPRAVHPRDARRSERRGDLRRPHARRGVAAETRPSWRASWWRSRRPSRTSKPSGRRLASGRRLPRRSRRSARASQAAGRMLAPRSGPSARCRPRRTRTTATRPGTPRRLPAKKSAARKPKAKAARKPKAAAGDRRRGRLGRRRRRRRGGLTVATTTCAPERGLLDTPRIADANAPAPAPALVSAGTPWPNADAWRPAGWRTGLSPADVADALYDLSPARGAVDPDRAAAWAARGVTATAKADAALPATCWASQEWMWRLAEEVIGPPAVDPFWNPWSVTHELLERGPPARRRGRARWLRPGLWGTGTAYANGPHSDNSRTMACVAAHVRAGNRAARSRRSMGATGSRVRRRAWTGRWSWPIRVGRPDRTAGRARFRPPPGIRSRRRAAPSRWACGRARRHSAGSRRARVWVPEARRDVVFMRGAGDATVGLSRNGSRRWPRASAARYRAAVREETPSRARRAGGRPLDVAAGPATIIVCTAPRPDPCTPFRPPTCSSSPSSSVPNAPRRGEPRLQAGRDARGRWPPRRGRRRARRRGLRRAGAEDGGGWAAGAARVAEIEARLEREAELEDAGPPAAGRRVVDGRRAGRRRWRGATACPPMSDADWTCSPRRSTPRVDRRSGGTRDREYGLQRDLAAARRGRLRAGGGAARRPGGA